MRLFTEIRLWLGILVVLSLVVALAGISLLSRTAPAVSHILDKNVQSLQAYEEMLAVLATPPEHRARPVRAAPTGQPVRLGAVDRAGQARYQGAISRARQNVTLHDEEAPLTEIARLAPATLARPGAARRRSVTLLGHVADINRAEMKRKDRWAQRLALAGSWTLVVLGVLSVLLGLFSIRRMMRRFVLPLREIRACLAASRAGDIHRRAHLTDAPASLVEMAQDLNVVLDRLSLPPAEQLHEKG